MYSRDDEVLKITGLVLPVRGESPALEIEAGRAIERAFRALIQSKYLYQKQEVDLNPIFQQLKASVESIIDAWATPREGGGYPASPEPPPLTEERFRELCAEVAARPWILGTRHFRDSKEEQLISKHARGISGALHLPISKMYLGFLLPSVQLQCLGTCKSEKTFSAHFKSCGNSYSQPLGLVEANKTEQLFFPIYVCGGCSQFSYTMLVQRKGLKIQLCGITPRRPLTVSDKIPEAIASILRDAEQSVAEGDRFAAIYHLRTMIEHYVKGRLGLLSVREKTTGDILIAKYNETIKEGLKGALPSLLTSWEFLSEALHSRSGNTEDYTMHRNLVCRHIETITTLGDSALLDIRTSP